jgi:hypothetical protein
MMLPSRMIVNCEKPQVSCVIGVYEALEPAEEALRILDAASFPITQITIVTPHRERGGLRLSGSLAMALLGEVEGVLYPGAAGWLRQLMAWGASVEAIHYYEKRVQSGRALLIAHGDESVTARALWLLAGKEEMELHFHPKSRAEWETAVLRG